MVRLKEIISAPASPIHPRFQFPNGSIKSVHEGCDNCYAEKFQFPNGSIKSALKWSKKTSIYLGFNSLMVRLKDFSKDGLLDGISVSIP